MNFKLKKKSKQRTLKAGDSPRIISQKTQPLPPELLEEATAGTTEIPGSWAGGWRWEDTAASRRSAAMDARPEEASFELSHGLAICGFEENK